MAHHALWRRLFGRKPKRRSYYENQHAMKAALESRVPQSSLEQDIKSIKSAFEKRE